MRSTAAIPPNPVTDVMFSLAQCCHKLSLLFFAVLTCCAASGLCAETAESDPPVAIAATAEETEQREIEQWTVQLDDDRFDIRQRAQQQLEQAGQPAIAAVAEVAKTGSLESSTRAINILLHWSESKEHGLRFAALENLARLTHRPRESAMATRLLAEARERTALETLVKFGATVGPDRQVHGAGNLQVVIGQQWQGGNEGLQHLANMSHATTISLHVAPLDGSAVDYLIKTPHVQRVELYGTKFSPEAVAKLKQQLPDGAEVVERGGAMLGIVGNVESVVKNSAADKAGIQARDRITEFNGEKVADFDALTQRIAKQKAGDTVTLTVLRNTQTLQVKVIFDQWGTKANAEANQKHLVPGQVPVRFPPKIIVAPTKRR